MLHIEEAILGLLHSHGLTVGVVESATGGLISHRLTNVPGISDGYKGGITAYANETKINVLGVAAATLERHGAVSMEVAAEMAAGGQRILKVDICLSDTGIAGPGGATPAKSVGLFYLGLAHGKHVLSRQYIFTGSREEIKTAAAEAGLVWLREYLMGLPG
ncbi:MAG: CinA family protein [Dehalococcoidia bacterium]|nr:CinA family protein [Dehalococcoidia bacterium]